MSDQTKTRDADRSQAAAAQAATAAAEAISLAHASMELSTGTLPGEALLADTVLDRLGVERRVLGFITDEVDKDAFGPRNTLHALTYALMNDGNTTHPPEETHGRLRVQGKSVAEVAQSVLDLLDGLVGAGLVKQREDGSYELTESGQIELAS